MGLYFETVISKQSSFVSPNERMDGEKKEGLSILDLTWSSEMSVSEMYETAMILKCVTLKGQMNLSEQLTRTIEWQPNENVKIRGARENP